MADFLLELARTLESRKEADPNSSYTAQLYSKGLDAILRKIGEEATETIIAAKGDDRRQLVYEVADLWFHTMVLLSHEGLGPQDVISELKRRFGQSGIDEKARRGRG